MRAPTPKNVPTPRLREVINNTPFPHFQCFKTSHGPRFHDVVIVRGSFKLTEGKLTPNAIQKNPAIADSWWDEANATRSSLKEVGDLLLYKPTTDVLITGTAQSPYDQTVPQWQAGVQVSQGSSVLVQHILNLTGHRYWQHGFFRGWHLSDPEPTVAVPLRYELAYGGTRRRREQRQGESEWETYKPNPSGSGFFDERELDKGTRYPGPQIERLDNPIREINRPYPLTGFGPVARFWASRTQYAGTYDTNWRQRFNTALANGEAPDYPADFNLRFFQYAPPELICPGYLRGNERIALSNLIADVPRFACDLPGIGLRAEILAAIFPTQPPPTPLALDTVSVDLDANDVSLTWRLCLPPEADVRAVALEMEDI